ncbi:MAG: type II toxin-antitoxin system HipA family toxin [Alphaproteobacteria bacterium]|nr:type II toxin-antitoxin system HipA family toxin [Alphaproteobacteria bacterium]
MAALRYGIVTYKDARVGTLRESPGGGTVFAYDEGVTAPIACALPIARREHATPFGLHPFFAHLAPEGWLRDRQTAFAEIGKDDDFGILLAFGADCIGAVGVVDPDDSHRRVALKPARDPLDAAAVAVERTISGVQAKVLCAPNGKGGFRPARAGEAAPLIAKYPQPPLFDMVANEATSLELCRILLGVSDVAAADLAVVEGIDGVALVVERFDRSGPGRRDKLRCEEFAQVVAQPPGLDLRGKYDVGYDALGRALAHSSARLLDARRLFKRLAAYVLVGNVDCHLKNFSLIETAEGLRLSPAYDVLNGYIYGDAGYTTRFGLTIDGQRRQWQDYDRALLLAIADEIGLPRKAAEGVLRELAGRAAAFERRLGEALRLGEERAWSYRNAAREAWERIHG